MYAGAERRRETLELDRQSILIAALFLLTPLASYYHPLFSLLKFYNPGFLRYNVSQ